MPVIVHIDMNSFFASCEVRRNPSLKGKKVIIGAMNYKDIVSAASYEAKTCGIYTTMPSYMAHEICREGIFLPVDHEYYCKVSEEIFSYLRKKYPILDIASIDEAYIDMSDVNLGDNPYEYFKALQKEVYEVLHIPCSIGVSYNRFLAKMGSDFKKPLGITIIKKKDVPEIIYPILINDMYGCGKATSKRLNEEGIQTIGDFVHADETRMREILGNSYESMLNNATGAYAERITLQHYVPKSVGNSHTLDYNTNDYSIIKENLKLLCDEVSMRLRACQMLGYTITLTIKDSNFQSSSKSKQILEPTDDNDKIFLEILKLLDNIDLKIIRLVGVSVSKLIFKEEYFHQLSLFAKEEVRHSSTEELIKKLNDLVGKSVFIKAKDVRIKHDESRN